MSPTMRRLMGRARPHSGRAEPPGPHSGLSDRDRSGRAAVTAVAAALQVAPVWLALLIALVSAGWCVLLGLAGHYVGERHPDAEPPAPPPLSRRLLASEFCLYAGAALVAGIIGVLSGLPSPYWAQVAAVVPLSAPGRCAQLERGIHRVIGTSLGVVVTAFLWSFPVEPWQLVVWVVLLQFLAEMFVLRNYSLALLFITPLALLMVQLAHPQPAAPLLTAGVVETAIGALVGMAAVGVAILLGRRRRSAEREPAQAPADSDPGTADPRTPRPSDPNSELAEPTLHFMMQPPAPAARTVNQIAQEIQTRGGAVVPTPRRTWRTAQILLLILGSMLCLMGLVLLVLYFLFGPPASVLIIAGGALVVGLLGASIGVVVRRKSQQLRGPQWTLSAAGVAVAGVGPVPWADLMPTEYRLQHTGGDGSWERRLIMPLTPIGVQRARGLPPAHRQVLNASCRDTLLTGPQELQGLLVPDAMEFSAAEFGQVLDWSRQHFLTLH